MNAQYLSVSGRIRREIQSIDAVVERTLRIWENGQTIHPEDEYHVDATALNIHSFYAGIERILEIIADSVDGTKPSGANWHTELLSQLASDIKGVRPAVISGDSQERLNRFRGFRHVVRNVYTFNLDAPQIALLVEQLQPTQVQIKRELLSFATLLDEMAEE
ncbi:MAG: hypothetical protein WBG63_11680 [Phormidesmis sp.]